MTSSVVFPKTTETVVLWPIWPTEYAGTDWNRLHYLHCRASKVPRLPEVGEAEVACDGLSIGPRQCAVHGLDEHLRSADESIDKQIVDKSPCKSESLQNKLDIPSPSKLSNARICFFFPLWTQYDSVQGVVRFEFARRLHLQMASHQSRFCKHQSRQLDFLTTQSRAAKNIMSMSITIWNSWPNTTIC
jgi:hypothetical protein